MRIFAAGKPKITNAIVGTWCFGGVSKLSRTEMPA